MKAIRASFLQMLFFVRRDKMLLLACLTPLLIGLLFKLGVPALSGWTDYALVPYYGLFDLFFAALTPTVFCFAAAMVMLEERDDHIEQYLFATPLGRRGYLLSRLGIPAAAAFLVTLILLPVFMLTSLSAAEITVLSALGAWQGVLIALLITTCAANKLEGMAVSKLASLALAGLLVPYFVAAPVRYAAALLPSFWMGEVLHAHSLLYAVPSAALALAWTALLWRVFQRRQYA